MAGIREVEFQSAPRERGERMASSGSCRPILLLFQSAPRERGERSKDKVEADKQLFQSAPRERGESKPTHTRRPTASVSIRAPRAGRKWVRATSMRIRLGSFNPRPASGAKDRVQQHIQQFIQFQSAPRERGERRSSSQRWRRLKSFQSAPRERGERTGEDVACWSDKSFNPRPASGAKARNAAGVLEINSVSIRAPRAGRKLRDLV